MRVFSNLHPALVLFHWFSILAALGVATPQIHGEPCTPPPSGLVGWWPAEGNANDIVGGDNGTLQGGATFAAGKVGLGFLLDGTNGYVQIPDSAALKPTNVTVEAWVWLDPNASTALNSEQIIFKRNSWTYFFEGYSLLKTPIDNGNGTYTNRFQFCITRNGNQIAINSITAVQRGVWYHVAATYDGTTATLYVNGAAEASAYAGFALDYGTLPVYIGTTGEPAPYNNKLAGIIDETSIYNRALATNEIAAIYNAGSAGKCASNQQTNACVTPPSGLVGWWKGDGSGVDAVAGNNGVLVNISYTNGVDGLAFACDPENYPYMYTGIQVADQPAYAMTNSLTIEGWVRPRGDGYVIFWRGDNRPGLDPYYLSMHGDATHAIDFGVTDANGNNAFVETTLNYNLWTYVAATLEGSSGTMSLYTNGVLAAQTVTTVRPFGDLIPGESPGVGIGNVNDGGNNFPFLGDIDEIALYNRALTTGEIQAIYNASSAGKCTTVEPTNNCVTPPFGLVSWWPGEGDANDITGANNGTAQNISYINGEVGNAFYLNGSNAYVMVPASSSLNVGAGSGFTIETWIDPTTLNPQPVVEWNGNSGDGGIGAHFWISEGKYFPGPDGCLYANIVDAGGGDHYFSTDGGVVVANTYQHIALTYDQASGTAVIYWNGTAVQTSNLGTFIPQTSFDFYLGDRPSGSAAGSAFGGAMDEPSLYNRALTAAEIQAIYNAGSAGKCTGTQSGVPAISNIAPVSGTNGTVVIISGSNFSATVAANIVYFGAVRATVSSSSLTNLVVAVPTGATFAPITVTVGGLTAYSSQLFEPTFTGNGSNITSSSFAPSFNLPGANGPQSMVIADLDGDGKPDIAFVNGYSHLISIYRNISTNGALLGAGSFAPRLDLSPATNGVIGDSYRLRAVDLDGDGKLDLIVCDVNSDHISIFHNLAAPGSLTTASFEAPFTLSASYDTRFATTADLDGDGRVDIVALNYGAKTISIYKNIGMTGTLNTNSFAPPVMLAAPGGPYEATIADLDGDGKLDLAVANIDNNTVSIYQSQVVAGTLDRNSFAPRVDFPGGVNPATIAAVDLDGDGKLDLVVGSVQSDNVNVYRNLSSGGLLTTNSFAAEVDFGTPGWMHTVAVADFNGDGKPDLGVVGELNSYMAIFQNTSSPGSFTMNSFAPRVDFGTGWNAWGIAAGDLDGDGRPDIVFGNYYDNTVQIYQNQVPFGTSSFAPTIISQTPSQVVLLGSAATFSVNVSGSDPLSYFWSRNSVLIPNATNSSYSLINAQLSDSGSEFSCLITNAYGSASSTNVSVKVIDTIANDLCSGAIVITSAGYTNTQSTLKASSFGDPVPDCVDGFGHGVWYQFTTPVAGRLIVDTFGSDFDTGLAIYTGSCDTPTEVACNDDTGGVTSQVILPTTAGMTYSILVGGYGSDAGNLVLHLTHQTPPAFVIQPTNLDVVVSSNASFATTLTGTLPMGLQWYFNNTPLVDSRHIGGSQSNTLIIARILTNDAGSYQLVASNIVGVATSSVAILTPIILPPVITQQPVDQSVLAGSNVTFTATVAGTPPYYYQWSFNGTPLTDDGSHITGSGTNSLTIANLTTADAGSYMLTVTNISGVTNSVAAVLTVLLPPGITLNPIGRSVPPGWPTIFNAAASGGPTPVYQWQLNGTNIPGATSSSYTNPAVGTNAVGFYHVVASNLVGVAMSADAKLTFGPVAAWGRNLNNECLPPPGMSNVTAIVGCSAASFAVRTDGTIAAWGSGSITNIPPGASNVVLVAVSPGGVDGAAAVRSDGTVVGWDPALPPITLSNVVSVAVGDFRFGCALRAEGTLIGWGATPYSSVPAGLNHVTAIACGSTHSLALRDDGTVVAWGSGAATNVPAGLANVSAIAAGYSHSLALKSNGTVVAWGSGSGTNLPAGLTNIMAISASGSSQEQSLCLALRANGRVVVWGDNLYGETNPPAALSNLVSIAIAAAPNHGLALVNDGRPVILHPPVGLTAYTGRDVVLHGDAAGAQPLSYQWLLNGTNLPGATNTTLVISNVQSGEAGNYQLFVSNNVNTALSLMAPLNVISNSALTFLSQLVGQTNYQGGKVTLSTTVLGSGLLRYQWFFSTTNQDYAAVPGATNDTLVLDPALAFNTGNYYVALSNQLAGVTSTPAFVRVLFARAWGYQAVSNPPVNVTDAIALAMSYNQSANSYFALGANGKLTAWAGLPAQYGETNVTPLNNSFVTAIAAGQQDALALKSDGTVYAWGFGLYGQTNPPTGLSSVIGIACGAYHDLALKADGSVVGWGVNSSSPYSPYNYGQATNNPAATNVVAIAAAQYRSLALRADGTVVSWGYGSDGTGIIPSSATNVIAITAGTAFNAALRVDGKVVQWGSGLANYPVPASLSNVVAISGSSQHCTALKNDGTVVSWGLELQTLASNNMPADLANVIAITSGGEQDMALFGTRVPAFTVQPWNRAFPLNAITNILLAAKCAGVQPVRYQWQLNGTNVPGATNDTLLLSNNPFATARISFIPSGAYQLIASNAYGIVASKYAKVTTFYPLADALDTTDAKGTSLYNWITSGNAQWFGETNVTHDGVDAAQSGGIGALQESILQTTVGTNWPGSYTFWWKASSEQDFDFLEFRVNGIAQTSISGPVNWQPVSIHVATGTNVLQWRYFKDASFDFGQDAGWVDQFAFVPDPPLITVQPVSQTVNMGTNVTMQVTAMGPSYFGGPAILRYQWRQNGNPVGGNNSFLVLNNVGRAQNGTYSVTVTNFTIPNNSIVSSNAVLKVLVPQLLGSPTLRPDGSFQLTSADANGGWLQPSDLANFEAQASTNLLNWVTLPNALSLTNGMLLLQDSTQSNYPTRFYRLLEH